ncbi:MAG: nucleotide exchange factor GrpE [Bacteroidales bacterium]|jgi:molecular chaperone GrpE|nr:nucleotide exchange factor GrpE [Bacteroidales bacterium]
MAEETNNDMEMTTDETLKKDNVAENGEKTVSVEKENKKKKSKKSDNDAIIEELGAKLEEISDKHLRLQAEFDNFRKRISREKVELIKSGGENVLVNILPVIDDFERALNSFKDISDDDSMKQGIVLIYNKFSYFLKQNNVTEIEALNMNFDIDLHEAVTKIPAPNESLKGKIVDVIQKGYLLNEKVIRFAKVVIGE